MERSKKNNSIKKEIIMTPKLLIIPGLGDSGVGHWQNFWLNHFPNTTKVTQDNWDQPLLGDWLERLEATLKTINEPIILVAHSLATILVAHWAKTFARSDWIRFRDGEV